MAPDRGFIQSQLAGIQSVGGVVMINGTGVPRYKPNS